MRSSESFETAYEAIEDTIAAGIGPDDTEQFYRVVKPLEAAVATVAEMPSGGSDSPADRIAGLLWCKTHADVSDASQIALLLRGIQDRHPAVRAIAARVLRDRTSSPRAGDEDQRVLLQMDRAIQEQLRTESSPLLIHVLSQLSTEIHKLLADSSPHPEAIRINPFIAGSPIHDDRLFFGREKLVHRIASIFDQEGSQAVLLYGSRRTGKTSLLLHLERGALGPAFEPVYINLQACAGRTELERVILESIAIKWPKLIPREGQLPDGSTLPMLMQTIESVIARSGRRLLLLFDEFELLDSFLPDPESAARLQSLFEMQPSLLAAYAGSKRLNLLSNSNLLAALDACKPLEIGFLERPDAERLVREPARGSVKFSDEAVGKIIALCGGHPFYLQLFCQTIFSATVTRGAAGPEDVEAAAKQLVASPPPDLILTWQALDNNQKLAAH
ncbi:MAG: ATP-binding protein [Acidobacteria bacterium]|nr:ATP-binding protein [Acidobacteriota bacterium]